MSKTLCPDPDILKFLEGVYEACNKRERLGRDPLALVVAYNDREDREVAGLVCSTLAFGSVDLILGACRRALAPLGAHPASALANMDESDIQAAWGEFQYRFCFPGDIMALMRALRAARMRFGSLEGLFLSGDAHAIPLSEALSTFVLALRTLGSKGDSGEALRPIRPNLLPDPRDGSACKRLFLFLRWMVRKDEVDPGGWTSISPSRLVVPMDTHMTATCSERLGFFIRGPKKRQPTLKDALAVTSSFALYSPGDPVKYDFALTRPGIDPMPGDEIYGCL